MANAGRQLGDVGGDAPEWSVSIDSRPLRIVSDDAVEQVLEGALACEPSCHR
jgi:hypothetical protein